MKSLSVHISNYLILSSQKIPGENVQTSGMWCFAMLLKRSMNCGNLPVQISEWTSVCNYFVII